MRTKFTTESGLFHPRVFIAFLLCLSGVSLALFRQLPAGVPGGARIFANLLGGNTIK